MGCVLELVWWSFGDVILRRTGVAILYAVTLGRQKPGEHDEWLPYVVGGLFWLSLFVVVFLLARRK